MWFEQGKASALEPHLQNGRKFHNLSLINKFDRKNVFELFLVCIGVNTIITSISRMKIVLIFFRKVVKWTTVKICFPLVYLQKGMSNLQWYPLKLGMLKGSVREK